MNMLIQNPTFWYIAVPLIILILLAAYLPSLLNTLGLHRHYAGRRFDLSGKRALIITTSQATLGENGKASGVYASEMTVPYYQFLDANMQVDLASIKGREIPVDPSSLRWPVNTPEDKRFLKDAEFQQKVKNSIPIADVDPKRYDLVFMAGGWGAAYDLGTSPELGQKISEAYTEDILLGSVCHGGLGFLQAVDERGNPLVKDRHMTAVTDKQLRELRITTTPQHPETELRRSGALFENNKAFLDIFASHVVVDGSIVTGQNQNDGAQVAQRLMEMIENLS